MLLKRIAHLSVIAGILILQSCGDKSQQKPMQGMVAAVSVAVQPVATTDAVYYDAYPATLAALSQVELRPQVNGYITGLYFKDGDRVHKGQKLYAIDQQQYEANYQQSLANLDVQKTNLVKAQKDADRYHQLDAQDAIAKQQVDYADAALEAAKKQVAAAEANVNAVQIGVKYSTLYAPFDGTIGISQVKLGSPVTAGQTVLNIVSTDNPMAVDFSVDQKEIYRFTKLLDDGNKKGDSTFNLAFGNDVYPVPGKISLIDRAVDPQTGTIKVRLIFPNDKNKLKAGMSASVRVKNNSSARSVVIPYKAITEQLGEFFVYVVNDSSKVNQRKLALGQQIGASVIVKDGLKEGERIVIQGVQNLREGASIRIDTAKHTMAGGPAHQ